MPNRPELEIVVAVGEQAKISILRLDKLLVALTGSKL